MRVSPNRRAVVAPDRVAGRLPVAPRASTGCGHPYWINTGFDPDTGKRLASWVRLPQESHVAVVDRRYDPDTGHPQFEQRYDWPTTGGKAVGAKTEDWFRKIERTFDASGKVTKGEVSRYDESVEGRWRTVGK